MKANRDGRERRAETADFVSYSHRDDEAKAFIDRHLGVLHMAGEIEVWSDDEIVVGDTWFQEIETNFEGCAIAILLISNDFLGSEFCIKKEVPVLLERRKHEGMMIAPILLRPCAWQIFPWLAAIQMQPSRDTPLHTLNVLDQEQELTKVVIAIHNFLAADAQTVTEAKTDTPYRHSPNAPSTSPVCRPAASTSSAGTRNCNS